MGKHTQTIRRQFADELLSVFDHSVGLALKGLTETDSTISISLNTKLLLKQNLERSHVNEILHKKV